ncbi:MAG: helix-turn-helix transcriptional regulator [Halospina sp.]
MLAYQRYECLFCGASWRTRPAVIRFPVQHLEERPSHHLLRLLAAGNPSLKRMARSLHMAPRTLQRRLARYELSWQQWLDHARNRLAYKYLADPALSLNDIALLLGYPEQSAFTRACRRWNARSSGQLKA